MAGICQTLLPFLANPFTYAGIGILGLAAKFLYSYSSLSFWPSFLTLSSLWRTLMVTISASLNLRRVGFFAALSFVTVFWPTINGLMTGQLTGIIPLLSSAGTDLWTNVVLVMKNLVTGLGFLVSWIDTSGNICGLWANKNLLFNAVGKFWSVAAAYILVLRVDDLWFGKGMTREIEWPERYKTIAIVTLLSTTVYSGELALEAVRQGQTFVQVLSNQWITNESVNATAEVASEALNTTE